MLICNNINYTSLCCFFAVIQILNNVLKMLKEC